MNTVGVLVGEAEDRRRKVPDELMHKLVRQGHRNVEILRILDEEHGIKLSRGRIPQWKREHGYEVRTRTVEQQELLPWKVNQAHSGHRLYRGLLAQARFMTGERTDPDFELPREDFSRRQKFLDNLARTGCVVHYDTVNGFVLVPPREGIDGEFIRDPRVADDSTPIENETLWQ